MISGLALTVAMASGCVRRVVQITSAPEGALVWMNDREVGSTPCEIEILHYGTYDVRVEKAGFEPVMTGRSANVPIWDLPGPDLIAEIVPADLESRTVWHFDLVVENTDADQVLVRAEAARDRLAAADAKRAADRKVETSADLASEVEAEDGTGRPGAPVEGAPVPVEDPEAPANSNLGQDPLIDPSSTAD
ncbi:MAG: PEGA domain-containing protein [Phycisphaerales bacterium]|nr:PEGA domain-containing protein [Phycisphaerales bacterium]